MTFVFILIVVILVACFTALFRSIGGDRLFGHSPVEIRYALSELSEEGGDIVLFKHDSGNNEVLADITDCRELDDLPDGRYIMVVKRSWSSLEAGRLYDYVEVVGRRSDPGIHIVFTKVGRELYISDACSGIMSPRYHGVYMADAKCRHFISALYASFAHSHYICISATPIDNNDNKTI